MRRSDDEDCGSEADASSHPGNSDKSSLDTFRLLDCDRLADELYGLDPLSHQILSMLMRWPGTTVHELSEKLHEPPIKTQSVLVRLKESGIVESETDRNVQKYYPVAVPEPMAKSWLRAAAKENDCSCVIEFLVAKPFEKQSINKIATNVNVSHAFVIQFLKELELRHLVKISQESDWLIVGINPNLVQFWAEIHNSSKEDW